jgi:hypothetical protein
MALGSMLLFGTAPRFESPRVVVPTNEITSAEFITIGRTTRIT